MKSIVLFIILACGLFYGCGSRGTSDYERTRASAHNRFMALDRNQDGFIDIYEYQGSLLSARQGGQAWFNLIDTNTDGKVSWEEVDQWLTERAKAEGAL